MAIRDSILVSRTIYQIGVITLVTAVMWVSLVVYQAVIKPFSVEVDKSLLEPVSATIDQEVITAISKRIKVENEVATESATIEETEKDELAN